MKIDWTIYTPFQQKVLKAIQKIPKGQVWTYKQLATKIGQPNAARAVGQALGKNCHAPQVPCHRVVGQNGWGGYSGKGGVRTKQKLLAKEGYRRE